jgi:hypothetical protein
MMSLLEHLHDDAGYDKLGLKSSGKINIFVPHPDDFVQYTYVLMFRPFAWKATFVPLDPDALLIEFEQESQHQVMTGQILM